jgi:N-acetylglucosaminyldiphosphoundecaprenol N-acetyl-beta-D-mannosaminyltransferase
MKNIIFNKIKFLNIKSDEVDKIIQSNGLFVFPSGPGLSTIDEEVEYYQSLKKADYVFFDSGYFVLLLRIFKNIKVNKFSGYKFLENFFLYLEKNNNKSVFCIDPSSPLSKSNQRYFDNLGISKIYNYSAPKYNQKNIRDNKLLKKLNIIKPNFILTNIGGGTQEILGLYLKKKLKFKTSIICTGGAISFFTGDQAPIGRYIDKFYLGWLVRIIYKPQIFFMRYLRTLKFTDIFFRYKDNIKIKY